MRAASRPGRLRRAQSLYLLCLIQLPVRRLHHIFGQKRRSRPACLTAYGILPTVSGRPAYRILPVISGQLQMLARSAKRTTPVHSSKMSDYYIKEAINFIEQNFQNNISIEEIAAVCGINRSYFGKIFRNTVGRSPQEFLMHYRMVKATELLKLTSLSIADIGSAVGYENQLHFSRAFKKRYGLPPREWRKENASVKSK